MKPLAAAEPADPSLALAVDHAALEDHFTRAAEQYDKDREAYLQLTADDTSLPAKSKKWQRSARKLAGWAQTWFMVYSDNDEEKQAALDILERITQESGLRSKNLWKHIDLMKEKDPGSAENLEKEEEAADLFYRRAIRTQLHYADLYEKGTVFTPAEIELAETAEVSAYLAKVVHKYPEDRIFTRAAIFPMERVPLDRPVQDIPDAYTRVKFLDPDVLEYDPAVDELVPVKGYVSEDGLIDERSVVWHPETMTVEIGYRGQPKETWRYWKPKDSGDMYDPDSWCGEYQMRAYRQSLSRPRKRWRNF